MNRKERKRLTILSQVKQGALSLIVAAGLLGLGYRQAKRVWQRYRTQGRPPDPATLQGSNPSPAQVVWPLQGCGWPGFPWVSAHGYSRCHPSSFAATFF